jgi:hypothetical protein
MVAGTRNSLTSRSRHSRRRTRHCRLRIAPPRIEAILDVGFAAPIAFLVMSRSARVPYTSESTTHPTPPTLTGSLVEGGPVRELGGQFARYTSAKSSPRHIERDDQPRLRKADDCIYRVAVYGMGHFRMSIVFGLERRISRQSLGTIVRRSKTRGRNTRWWPLVSSGNTVDRVSSSLRSIRTSSRVTADVAFPAAF